MNTRTLSCRTVCLPLMVAVVLSACGYKGPLYLPPSAVEPTHDVSAVENSNTTTAPAVSNTTRAQIPIQKKVVRQ